MAGPIILGAPNGLRLVNVKTASPVRYRIETERIVL